MSEQYAGAITMPSALPFEVEVRLADERENNLDARFATLYNQLCEETDELKSELESLKSEIEGLTATVNALQEALWRG